MKEAVIGKEKEKKGTEKLRAENVTNVSQAFLFCPRCGHTITGDTFNAVCPNCGYRFCPSCSD